MKFLVYIPILFLSLVAPAMAEVVTFDLTCQPPTTRTDGAALPGSEISEYRFYSGVDGPISTVPTVVSPSEVGALSIDLAVQVNPYVVNFACTVVDTLGQESSVSNIITKSYVVQSTAPPAIPAGLSVTASCVGDCQIIEVTQ